MNENTIRRYLVLLNLPHRFTEVQLKQSYRDISQVWHPDKHAHNPRLRDKAEAIFKEVNAAYQHFKKEMRSGVYEFVESQHGGPPPRFESGPEMDEILRVIEEELKKQYDGRIRDMTSRYESEVNSLRRKHSEYISRISRAQNETKAQYEERVRNLSSSLASTNEELSRQKTKAEHLQNLVQRSLFSFSAARRIFKHGVAEPVCAVCRIGADFIRLSCGLLARLSREHLPDRFDRVLIMSTLGFLTLLSVVILAVVAPRGLLLPVACVFAIVASTVHIAKSTTQKNEKRNANNTIDSDEE